MYLLAGWTAVARLCSPKTMQGVRAYSTAANHISLSAVHFTQIRSAMVIMSISSHDMLPELITTAVFVILKIAALASAAATQRRTCARMSLYPDTVLVTTPFWTSVYDALRELSRFSLQLQHQDTTVLTVEDHLETLLHAPTAMKECLQHYSNTTIILLTFFPVLTSILVTTYSIFVTTALCQLVLK